MGRLISMFPIQTHLKMLADSGRVDAYKQGISQNVHPGDIVVDIGTGTGILAFLALQAGAVRVYALESGHIVETARKIAADNGLLDNIIFMNTDSREVDLPERVDVIITETFGGMGIDEGALEILCDARERFLKPGGRVLPECLNLQVVPVHFQSRHPFASLPETFNSIAIDSLTGLAMNTCYGLQTAELEDCRIIGSPGTLLSLDLNKCQPQAISLELVSDEINLSKAFLDGAVVVPEMIFPGGATLSLMSGQQFVATHWELAFFPISKPLPVAESDRLVFHLTMTRNHGLVWKHLLNRSGEWESHAYLSAYGMPALKKAMLD